MTNPPAGAPLLFGALADSGRIKQRKNGKYRMVLNGVDEIDWFTDRPYRYEGLWKPQKLIRRWGMYFATSEPNAQAAVEIGEDRHLLTFEMFKPRYDPRRKIMKFDIDASIINKREGDLADKLTGKKLTDVSLFIDDATTGGDSLSLLYANFDDGSFSNTEDGDGTILYSSFVNADLSGFDFSDMYLSRNTMTGATLEDAIFTNLTDSNTSFDDIEATGADFSDALLYSSDFTGANLTNVDFTDATIYNVDFTDADLTGADFSNVTWSSENSTFSNTTCTDGTTTSDSDSNCGFF